MSLPQIWSQIFNTAAQGSTALVYLGIGAAMGSYNQLTPANNQQFPCFLNKFGDNKVIVLFDPDLEKSLKIEQLFQEIGDPLILVNSEFKDEKIYFRELRTKSNSVTIFAINDIFNIYHNHYHHDEESERYNHQVDITISNVVNLIEICLGKPNKTKLIMQNYAGSSTVHFYNSLLSMFDKDDMLKNVIFDVTGQDPGCFWEITEEYPVLDDNGNFIQINYMQLSMMKGNPLFRQNLVKRIDNLVYPVTSNYVILTKDPSFEPVGMDRIMNMCTIYSVDFNDSSKNRDYLLPKFMELIQIMLADILSTTGSNLSIDYLIQLMNNRNEFINTMAKLKIEK